MPRILLEEEKITWTGADRFRKTAKMGWDVPMRKDATEDPTDLGVGFELSEPCVGNLI